MRLTMKFLTAWTLVLMLYSPPSCQAQTLQWTRQLGTSSEDWSFNNGVSADALGNVYLSGHTEGALAGTNKGAYDAFITKHDSAGNLLWTRQFGTTGLDAATGVSADGLGSVYVSGETGGSLGRPNAGTTDAFLAKYDAAGSLQWTRQLGTAAQDEGAAVSADGLGNVYLSGRTQGSLGGPNAGSNDAFLAKYTAAGALEWTRQLGTSASDLSRAVSADGLGNVYLSGWTFGNLGGANAGAADAFVAKYDATGSLQWTRQLGTGLEDNCFGVSADGLGNVYIVGTTEGSLAGPSFGSRDAFIAKYDAAGNLQWLRQFGTDGQDGGNGISADVLGNVYISGDTTSANGGQPDAYLAKYDAFGNQQWTRQSDPMDMT